MKTVVPPDAPIIIMTRYFQAPRELVWSVLTDPRHVAEWFGGHGFSNPICEMD
ncbi:MAG: SRPBCC domain-containing protein, partial [Deltaproteobacteria bacterium]|nr:SRPBCC domain-containing protein [Deltaproteobacteria bacterium]